MPIYEYEREDGTVFEFIQKINDEPLSVCPQTGQKVKRLVSQSAFHLKGGGWYKTDYAGGKSSGASTSSSETTTASPSSSSTENTKSDTSSSATASAKSD